MANISMDIVRYDMLVAAALGGDIETVRSLDMQIRREAGTIQYRVWVRWLELGGAPAPSANPVDWPVSQMAEIVLDRAIERNDVDVMLENRGVQPTEIHVTHDPEGLVGWYTLDSFIY